MAGQRKSTRIVWRATCPLVTGTARGELQLNHIETPLVPASYAFVMAVDGNASVAAFVDGHALVKFCEAVIEHVRGSGEGKT